MKNKGLNNIQFWLLIFWIIVVVISGLVEKELFKEERSYNKLDFQEPPKLIQKIILHEK